jgi:hypothetical protein
MAEMKYETSSRKVSYSQSEISIFYSQKNSAVIQYTAIQRKRKWARLLKKVKPYKKKRKSKLLDQRGKNSSERQQRPFQSWGKTPSGNFKVGKFVWNSPHETGITCFRCWRPAHIVRDCRSANACYVISSMATNNAKFQPELIDFFSLSLNHSMSQEMITLIITCLL